MGYMNFIKDLNEEYEIYLENFAKGSKEVTDLYNAMHDSFEEYISAVSEHEWKEGFNYAMHRILGGGAK